MNIKLPSDWKTQLWGGGSMYVCVSLCMCVYVYVSLCVYAPQHTCEGQKKISDVGPEPILFEIGYLVFVNSVCQGT